MKKLLLVGVALLAMTGCTDPNNAQRTLADQGYTKIQTKGYGFLLVEEKTFIRLLL